MNYQQLVKEHPEYLLYDLEDIFDDHTALADLVVAAKCETCFEDDMDDIYTPEAVSDIITAFGEAPWEAIFVQAMTYLENVEDDEDDKPPGPNDFEINYN